MFVRAGSDADSNVGHLPFTPQDTLRELVNLHAGFQHLVAGIGGAVRNSDAVAEEG